MRLPQPTETKSRDTREHDKQPRVVDMKHQQTLCPHPCHECALKGVKFCQRSPCHISPAVSRVTLQQTWARVLIPDLQDSPSGHPRGYIQDGTFVQFARRITCCVAPSRTHRRCQCTHAAGDGWCARKTPPVVASSRPPVGSAKNGKSTIATRFLPFLLAFTTARCLVFRACVAREKENPHSCVGSERKS